jgi:2-C-methyl-D-erythritol 2,4-cyclodiphosphate synthase
MNAFAIGQGFDVHRFRAGRPLRLCGVTVPSDVGLDGHSDADVALHAVADAVLGAVGGGDIGELFPPTEARWRDADSRDLLRSVVQVAAELGFRPANVDVTIVGERPRISSHRDAMRRSLAELMDVPLTAASVKATTTEGLGCTGRGEGLAAMAVVLMERVEG